MSNPEMDPGLGPVAETNILPPEFEETLTRILNDEKLNAILIEYGYDPYADLGTVPDPAAGVSSSPESASQGSTSTPESFDAGTADASTVFDKPKQYDGYAHLGADPVEGASSSSGPASRESPYTPAENETFGAGTTNESTVFNNANQSYPYAEGNPSSFTGFETFNGMNEANPTYADSSINPASLSFVPAQSRATTAGNFEQADSVLPGSSTTYDDFQQVSPAGPSHNESFNPVTAEQSYTSAGNNALLHNWHEPLSENNIMSSILKDMFSNPVTLPSAPAHAEATTSDTLGQANISQQNSSRTSSVQQEHQIGSSHNVAVEMTAGSSTASDTWNQSYTSAKHNGTTVNANASTNGTFTGTDQTSFAFMDMFSNPITLPSAPAFSKATAPGSSTQIDYSRPSPSRASVVQQEYHAGSSRNAALDMAAGPSAVPNYWNQPHINTGHNATSNELLPKNDRTSFAFMDMFSNPVALPSGPSLPEAATPGNPPQVNNSLAGPSSVTLEGQQESLAGPHRTQQRGNGRVSTSARHKRIPCPYPANECDYIGTFYDKKSLLRHIKGQHTKDSQPILHCPGNCNQTEEFSRADALHRHLKNPTFSACRIEALKKSWDPTKESSVKKLQEPRN